MTDAPYFMALVVLFAAEFWLGMWRGKVVERRERIVRRPPYKLLHLNPLDLIVIDMDLTGEMDSDDWDDFHEELSAQGLTNVVVMISGGVHSFDAIDRVTAEEILARIVDGELAE